MIIVSTSIFKNINRKSIALLAALHRRFNLHQKNFKRIVKDPLKCNEAKEFQRCKELQRYKYGFLTIPNDLITILLTQSQSIAIFLNNGFEMLIHRSLVV